VATHAFYLRLPEGELRRFVAAPVLLAELDLAAPLRDGRAIDLGGGWDELGCLLEGGISTPSSGPTVGDQLVYDDTTETWSSVDPERVRAIAAELAAMTAETFLGLYLVGDDGTAELAVDDHAGAWSRGSTRDRADRLYQKLERLRDHYEAAKQHGEAMLVRIATARG
jgi:hypothetical protein